MLARTLPPLTLLFLAGSLAGPWSPHAADAAPHTAHFGTLQAALQGRFDRLTPDSPVLQAAERRSIARALAALARTSTSLTTDLKLLTTVARHVESRTAEQPEIRTGLGAALAGLRTDVGGVRDGAAAQVGDVLSPNLRRRLDASLQRIDSDLTGVDGAPDVAAASRLLQRAHRRALATTAAALRTETCRGPRGPLGRGYVASRVQGQVVEPPRGGAVVSVDGSGALTNVVVFGYARPADPPEIRIEFGTGVFTGAGTYDIGLDTGTFLAAEGASGRSDAVSGSVVVTAFDAKARRLSGRFDAILADGSQVTAGRFHVCAFAVETIVPR